MQSLQFLTDDNVRKVASLYNRRYNKTEIARRMVCNVSSVYRALGIAERQGLLERPAKTREKSGGRK